MEIGLRNFKKEMMASYLNKYWLNLKNSKESINYIKNGIWKCGLFCFNRLKPEKCHFRFEKTRFGIFCCFVLVVQYLDVMSTHIKLLKECVCNKSQQNDKLTHIWCIFFMPCTYLSYLEGCNWKTVRSFCVIPWNFMISNLTS